MVLCSFQGACRSPSSFFILPHHSGLVNCFFSSFVNFFPCPLWPPSPSGPFRPLAQRRGLFYHPTLSFSTLFFPSFLSFVRVFLTFLPLCFHFRSMFCIYFVFFIILWHMLYSYVVDIPATIPAAQLCDAKNEPTVRTILNRPRLCGQHKRAPK